MNCQGRIYRGTTLIPFLKRMALTIVNAYIRSNLKSSACQEIKKSLAFLLRTVFTRGTTLILTVKSALDIVNAYIRFNLRITLRFKCSQARS